MKRNGKILISLVTGLGLGANAWALTADTPGNPYQGIVERNVFALKPPAPDPSTVKPEEPEPPEIIPTGIMSIGGRQQAMFKTKVPGGKPGAPPQEVGVVLSVGQREGEVEVLAIDEITGTITFRNHGKIQEKNLEKDGPKPVAGPAPAPFPGIAAPGARPPVPGATPGATPTPAAPPGIPAPTTFGGAQGTALKNIPSLPSRTVRLPSASGTVLPTPTTAGVTLAPGTTTTANPATQTAQPQPKPLTIEEQAVLMAIEREKHRNDPTYPPMPPIPGIDD